MNQRQRAVVYAGLALVVIWAVALTGYTAARSLQATADKLRAYVASVDLGHLPAAERARAIEKLEKMLTALSPEERQEVRLDASAYRWFDRMSEAERRAFLEATMPAGFKQVLTAFTQLPEDRQWRVIDQTLRQLRTSVGAQIDTNALSQLSPALLMQIRAQGLDNFYTQSPAELQAQMAPVLEELQRVMQTGGRFRGRGGFSDGRGTNSPAGRGPG